MKADKNAAGTEKRSTKAFYPELAERKGSFDLLHLLQKAEPAVPQHERFDDNDRRTQGKIEKLARFPNALKNLTRIAFRSKASSANPRCKLPSQPGIKVARASSTARSKCSDAAAYFCFCGSRSPRQPRIDSLASSLAL